MNILKQLTEWDTALRRKFDSDIFFSTRVKIALSLVAFLIAIVTAFIVVLTQVKKIVMSGMLESLTTALTTGVSDISIIEKANSDVQFATYLTVILILLFGVLAGLLLTRLALAPIAQAFTMQKRFISGIAHELRTPLSLLRVNNELARFGEEEGSHYATLFDENISDIDQITEMLNNLLLFDRMATVTKLKFEDIDILKLIETIINRLGTLAVQKNISITPPNGEIPHVRGNITALEQVFFNILKNAIAYTKVGGTVSVLYKGVLNDNVTLSVTDTGIGIPEKDLSRIFEPFYRTEKTGKLSGTGIGLAIVYEIIKIHKGTIEVESTEGVGTTFTLSLPVGQESDSKIATRDTPSKIFFNFTNTTPS